MRVHKTLLGKCVGILLVAFLLVTPSASLIAKAEVVEDLFTVEYNANTFSLINTEVSGTVLLDGNFNDPQGLANAKMGLNGIWFCEFVAPESGYRDCSIDTTTLPNGVYSITFWAQNLLGVEKQLEYPIFFTISNPVEEPVDITSPIFHLKDVTRDENESAPDYSEFVNINPESLPISCTGLENVDMTVAQPHTNKLVLVTCMVQDAAGNQTTSQASLIVNNVQPKVVIIASPSTSVNSGASINLVGNILAGNGHFSYYWFGACSGTGHTAGGLTSNVSVSLGSGSHLCGIMVTDADGDTAAASVSLDFGVTSNTGTVNGSTTSTEESNSTPERGSDTNSTEDESDAQVEGVTTEEPVSNPDDSNTTTDTDNNDSNAEVASANAGASPLVIICLVAGGILIIALLLFLFFRGEDEDEETAAAA